MYPTKNSPSWGEAIAKVFGGLFVLALAIGGFAIVLALLMMFKAYVFTQLWGWFVMPIFPAAPMGATRN